MSGGLFSGWTSYASGAISKAKEQFKELAAEESDSQDEEAIQQALINKIKDLERALNDKGLEVDELQDMLKSHISESATSQRASIAKLDNLEAQLADATENLVSLNIVVGFSDNAELQAYTTELDTRLKASEDQVNELQRLVQTQEEELEEHRVKEEALTEELLTTKEEHDKLQEVHQELQGKAENIYNLNKSLVTKLTETREQKAETDALNIDYVRELKAYKDELGVISAQLKETEQKARQVDALKDEISQLRKAQTAKDSQIEQLTAKHTALDSRLRSEVQSSLEYQRRFEALEAKNHALSEQAKTHSDEVEQARRKNEDLQSRLEATLADLKAHSEAASNLNSKVERLSRQLMAAETQLKTTNEILNEHELKDKAQTEQIQKYERDLGGLHNQVTTLTALKASFEQDAKVFKLDADRRNERLRSAEAEVTKYKEAAMKLQDLTEELRLQLDSKDALLDRLSTTIDEAELRALQAESAREAAIADLSLQSARLKDLESEAQLAYQIADEKVRQCNGIKTEAEALLAKFQSEVQVSEHYVDRRVINTFLVKFFNPSNSANVKQQMLETLANILDFTSDQREEVGLIEPEGLMSDFHQFITRED